MYCLWCWVLGVLFWRSHCCLLELKSSCCVSGCATRNNHWGITPGSGRATVETRPWDYKLCPILVLMLEGELLPCMDWFPLCCWKEALAETVPGDPACVVLTEGRILWERVSCSVQLPSSHQSSCPEVQLMSMSLQILSLGVFHVWTLLVALLNTAPRLSDPRVALPVGYFKLISRLLP